MKEYKIGPIGVDSLWKGLGFHLFRYFKVLGIFYFALALTWLAGMLGMLIRGKTVQEMPNLLPILISLSIVTMLGLLAMFLSMAKRDAFNWFSIDELGISFFRNRNTRKKLRKIRYEQIKFIVISKPGFFYSDLKNDRFLLGIRYRKDRQSSSLDSVVTLGVKGREQIEDLMNDFAKKCPDAIVFPDKKITEYKFYD